MVGERRGLTMYLSDLPGRYNINDDQASIRTGIPGEQLSQNWVWVTADLG